jgi:hypothetical protein
MELSGAANRFARDRTSKSILKTLNTDFPAQSRHREPNLVWSFNALYDVYRQNRNTKCPVLPFSANGGRGRLWDTVDDKGNVRNHANRPTDAGAVTPSGGLFLTCGGEKYVQYCT